MIPSKAFSPDLKVLVDKIKGMILCAQRKR